MLKERFDSSRAAFGGAAFLLIECSAVPLASLLNLRTNLLGIAVPSAAALLLAWGLTALVRTQTKGVKFIALTVLLISGAAAIRGVHLVWHGRFEALRAELKQRGYPLSTAEFQEDFPDDRYAFPTLDKPFAEIQRQSFDRLKHPGLEAGPWSPETLKAESAAIEPYVREIERTIVPGIEKYPRLFKIDYVNGARNPTAIPVPRLMNIILVAQILSLDAVSKTYRGDVKAAWANVRLVFALDGWTSQSHTLIGQMISVALRRIAVKTVLNMQYKRPAARLPDDIAADLRRILSDSRIADALRAEVAKNLDMHDYLEKLSPDEFMKSYSESYLQDLSGYFYGFLRKMGSIDIAGLRFVPVWAIDDTWPNDWPKLKAREREAGAYALPIWVYSSDVGVLPRVPSFYQKEWEVKTWAQLALVADAIDRYEDAHRGRVPPALDQLSPSAAPPDLLRDAFAGGPFHYAALSGGTGFELSSVGPDGDGKDSHKDQLLIRR